MSANQHSSASSTPSGPPRMMSASVNSGCSRRLPTSEPRIPGQEAAVIRWRPETGGMTLQTRKRETRIWCVGV